MPIVTNLRGSYKLWHSFLIHLPRLTRYTLGIKIDNLFTDVIEITLTASYARREEKLLLLERVSRKLDSLKQFLTILWEVKGLETNKYAQLAGKLITVGKMIGGWVKELQGRQ